MKIKKIIIFVICIGFIIFIPNWLISLYSSSGEGSPKAYSSVEQFEKETGVMVYNFYDLVEYFTYDKKIPLKVSTNSVSLFLQSNNKEEKNYRIEIIKDGYHGLSMFNNLFREKTENMKKDVLDNGILYQYHGYDESDNLQYFSGIYVKDNLYYSISYKNNDIDVSTAEQKMIDYIKLVEKIN